MRRMALCAASMLLLGCLAGCSTTPQNSQEQGNPVIKEEISQPLGGSEALGNSEDSSALSAADKEKMFAPYEQYGMTYDAVKDELTYNGNLVRWFEDYYPISNNETAGIDFLNENGTVDVYAVRDLESFSKAADGSVDPAGKLIGLKEFTQQEFDARDIDSVRTFVNIINRFDGEFDLGRGNRLVDAKSIIGICSCDLSRPVELLIYSDDRRILDALQGYIV